MLISRQLYAAIRADLLISNALFELVYVLVYVSCHIFVTRAHDCLPPYIQILATSLPPIAPRRRQGRHATAHGEPRVPSGVPFPPPNPR